MEDISEIDHLFVCLATSDRDNKMNAAKLIVESLSRIDDLKKIRGMINRRITHLARHGQQLQASDGAVNPASAAAHPPQGQASREEVNVSKKIADDLQVMVNNKEFSDFQFNVSGKIFFAHKIILSSRSPVFAAMFRSEMKETLNNMVIIDDIDHEVFEEFLTFVYTGKAPKISALANSLLPVADKYGMTQLKSVCEESVGKQNRGETVDKVEWEPENEEWAHY